MKTNPHLRRTDEFDRGREFIVVRDFKVDGNPFSPGQRFDQTLVTVRRLRQMYDAHMIDVEPEKAAVTHAATESGDAKAEMTNKELAARLANSGIVIRPNASREWLLRKVREVSGE